MSRLCALLTLLILTPLSAADWPRFLGPSGSGISPETGINKEWGKRPPRLLWKVALTDDGYSGPAVAAGLVFIIDHQGSQDIVRALELASGKERWRFRTPDEPKRLYGYARATPSVAGGKVYTLSRLGLACCLDAKSGRKLWSRDVRSEFRGAMPQWQYSMSPLVDDDRLILCPGGRNAAVVGLNRHTGKTIWAGGGSDRAGYATPVAATLGGKKQYVVFAGAALLGVDAATGRLLWRYPWETPLDPEMASQSAKDHFNANAGTPIVSGGTIFVTTGYGVGAALLGVSGSRVRPRWKSKEMQSQYTTPIPAGGHVYCTSDPGRLVCLEWATGRLMWKQAGFGKGGLAAVDGCLIVMDSLKGDVALVKLTPAGYQELGRIRPLGGESRTAPVIAEKRLLVRNRKYLACLDLR